MFKNAVIAILSSALWHTTMCEFNVITFLSLAAVLFFAVWATEEKINEIKSMKVFQRRMQKKIEKSYTNKNIPKADQAS